MERFILVTVGDKRQQRLIPESEIAEVFEYKNGRAAINRKSSGEVLWTKQRFDAIKDRLHVVEG